MRQNLCHLDYPKISIRSSPV